MRDYEWGQQGHDSARRNLLTPAQVIGALYADRRLEIEVAGGAAYFVLGQDPGTGAVLFVTCDRVARTNIYEITGARAADADERAVWERRTR